MSVYFPNFLKIIFLLNNPGKREYLIKIFQRLVGELFPIIYWRALNNKALLPGLFNKNIILIKNDYKGEISVAVVLGSINSIFG